MPSQALTHHYKSACIFPPYLMLRQNQFQRPSSSVTSVAFSRHFARELRSSCRFGQYTYFSVAHELLTRPVLTVSEIAGSSVSQAGPKNGWGWRSLASHLSPGCCIRFTETGKPGCKDATLDAGPPIEQAAGSVGTSAAQNEPDRCSGVIGLSLPTSYVKLCPEPKL